MHSHILDIISSSTVQIATQRIGATWTWYIIRGAGFTAAGLLILLMLSGIGQVTGLTYRFFNPIRAWAIHKALAIALCVAIVLHVGFLLIDHYIRFSWVQVLIPFVSHYQRSKTVPLGRLWIAFGIIAMYLVAIVVASSLGWINTKSGRWKKLHYLSYLIVILVFFHALFTGTDLTYGTFRTAWIVMGIIILIAIASRLWRAGTMKTKD